MHTYRERLELMKTVNIGQVWETGAHPPGGE